VVLVVAAAV